MVEIFKTDVQKQKNAKKIVTVLAGLFPLYKINFDLKDRDKILRVAGENILLEKIIEIVRSNGYQCQVVE
jgi:hypothetical protein